MIQACYRTSSQWFRLVTGPAGSGAGLLQDKYTVVQDCLRQAHGDSSLLHDNYTVVQACSKISIQWFEVV